MISEKYITVTDAAKQLNLTSGHVRQLCIDGKFPEAEKMGKTWIIPREAVEKYQPEEKGFAAVWKKKHAREAAQQAELQQAIDAAKRK
jgi:excisionase family DNA binding protein